MDDKVFEARPGNCAVLLPDSPKYTVVNISNDLARSTGVGKSVINSGYFEAFFSPEADPSAAPMQSLRTSFDHVVLTKKAHQLPPLRFTIKSDKGSVDKFWRINNIPIINAAGELLYILHNIEEITDEAARVQDEEKIRGIEKAYHVFMNAPVIVGILRGDDYLIELANEGLLEVWGRTAEVIGQPLLQAIPELAEQGFISLLDQVRETGEPFYAYEFPIELTRNGQREVLFFDFVYKPIYDEGANGKASGIISVGHDVTAQVYARRKVKESEGKYRNLFDSLDQGFCVIEIILDDQGKPYDYRFLETNPVFSKQTGLVDAVGKTARELVPNLESHWVDLYGSVALTGESRRFTEGSEVMGRWFEVYAFRFGEARKLHVALLFTDITERRKNEEALRQNEKNLRNTILQAPVAMSILKGEDYVVEIANDKMFELWGKSKTEMRGAPLFKALPEARSQGYEELLRGVYTTGESYSAHGVPVTLPRNGVLETVYINLLYAPFREGDGVISGILVIATDVTEQVVARQKIEDMVADRTRELALAHDALVHTNEELKRSNANLEEFAYAASHDLKEPMRKIQLFSDRLKDRLQDQLEPEDKNYFERILYATDRMNTLIDDLLLYSDISRGAVMEEEIDLNKKVQMVLDDLELAIAEKGAVIKVDELPVVKGHRRQLQQLFQNLISNAIKYSKTGVVPEVTINSRTVTAGDPALTAIVANGSGSFHLIEVTDNGIGFAAEDAERIFNVFTRLHGNAEYKGTGVGLSIARKVVENHGGYIWAESRPGGGASFKVLLPAEL